MRLVRCRAIKAGQQSLDDGEVPESRRKLAMSIQCTCPECGYRYKIANELAGKTVLCPECQTRFKARRQSDSDDTDDEQASTSLGRRSLAVWILIAGGIGAVLLAGIIVSAILINKGAKEKAVAEDALKSLG